MKRIVTHLLAAIAGAALGLAPLAISQQGPQFNTPSKTVSPVNISPRTGSGSVVLGTSPTITTPTITNPTIQTATNTIGSTYVLTSLNGGGGLSNASISVQATASVTNAATTIAGVGNVNNLLLVTGQGSGAIFGDLVLCGFTGNTCTAVSSTTQQGSPASRTYTVSSGVVQLAMGTATSMQVKALVIAGGT